MIYQVSDVTFQYHTEGARVLDRVSLSVDAGEVVVLLGPNGAGKTTLLHCMMRLLKPSQGGILLDGRDLESLKPKEIASLAAFVPQSHEPSFDYSVLDFVLLGRAPRTGLFGRPGRKDEQFCLETLGELGLSELAGRSYMELSGGERQQVLIARALAQEPRILVFDEPTAHLDLGNQARVLRLIRRMADKGLGVLMTSHNPDHALMAGDRTAVLKKGGALLSEVYGTDLQLVPVPGIGLRACLPFESVTPGRSDDVPS